MRNNMNTETLKNIVRILLPAICLICAAALAILKIPGWYLFLITALLILL